MEVKGGLEVWRDGYSCMYVASRISRSVSRSVVAVAAHEHA